MQEQTSTAVVYSASLSKWLALFVVIMGTFMSMLDE
jgi:hypothetical protein